MMDQNEIETRIKNIDERTTRIEQILPTFATKADLAAFATKADLTAFATKADLTAFATKDDLKEFPTRDEMAAAIREEGELTRAHFNGVAERIEESVKVIAEGHEATKAQTARHATELQATLSAHDRRIMRLEAESLKRR